MAVIPRLKLRLALEQVITQARQIDHAEVGQLQARNGAGVRPVDGLLYRYAAHFGKGLDAAQVEAVVLFGAHRVHSCSRSCWCSRATLTMVRLPTFCDGK